MKRSDSLVPFEQAVRRRDRAERQVAPRPDPLKEHLISARFDSETYREFKTVAAINLLGTDDLLAYGISLAFQQLGRPLPPGLQKKLKKAGLGS